MTPGPARTPCKVLTPIDASRLTPKPPPIDPYPSHRSQIETVLDETTAELVKCAVTPDVATGGVYGEAQEGGSAARDVQGRLRGHSSNVGSGVDESGDFRPERWERVRDVRGVSRGFGGRRAVGEVMRAPGAESVRSQSGSSTWLESSIEKFFT